MVLKFSRFFLKIRPIRFIIAGGTAACVNLILLYVFTDIFGVWYLSSAVFAFNFAFIVSFILQKFWTFNNLKIDGAHSQLFLFLFFVLINLALNTLVMYLLVEKFEVYYILAQIISGAFIAMESFFVYKNIVFPHPGES